MSFDERSMEAVRVPDMTGGQPRTREQTQGRHAGQAGRAAADVWVATAAAHAGGRQLLSGAVVAGLD